jgi:phage shock protein PspC (stress-responsive transcriptional regulator)
MNKVFHINLGSYPFTIDEDAYERLRAYLDAIHRHFRSSEGYEEITLDIEARLAELFQERLGSRPIVNMNDVEAAISTMGTPEDFGATPMEEGPSTNTSEGAKTTGIKTGKRLFRDPDDAIVGGVCAGIAAYFGIQDPVWVRLAFVLFTLSGGFGIPLYLILWAIVPQAATAGDRLAMRGEPINVSNIGRIIEEEIEKITNKVSEFGEEISGKKKAYSSANEFGRNALAQGISVIGEAAKAVLVILAQLWRPALILIAIVFGALFLAGWVAAVVGLFQGFTLLNYLGPELKALAIAGAFNLLFVVGLPLVAVVLVIARLLFGARLSRPWSIGMFLFWLLNISSLSLIAANMARDFTQEAGIAQTVALQPPPSDTLRLALSGHPFEKKVWLNLGDDLRFTERQMILRNVRLDISRAADAETQLSRHAKARGKTVGAASDNAAAISYAAQWAEGTLTLADHTVLEQGDAFRGQRIRLELLARQGQVIFIDKAVAAMLGSVDLADRDESPWRYPGRYWRMEERGLSCLDCL